MPPDAPRSTLPDLFTVMAEPRLSEGAKVLWALYRKYDFRGDGAFPSDETLAAHLGGKSVRSVRRLRSELREAGYLEQRLRGPQPPAYLAVVPAEGRTTLSAQEPEGGTEMAAQGRTDTSALPSRTDNHGRPRVDKNGHSSERADTRADTGVRRIRETRTTSPTPPSSRSDASVTSGRAPARSVGEDLESRGDDDVLRRAPTRELVPLVYRHLWVCDEQAPPPAPAGAPPNWTAAADLRCLAGRWGAWGANPDATDRLKLLLEGFRVLLDGGEFTTQGQPLRPGTPVTMAYVDAALDRDRLLADRAIAAAPDRPDPRLDALLEDAGGKVVAHG